MSIYDELRPVATELLTSEDFKQGVMQYVKVVPGAGAADDPGAPTETPYTLAGGAARGVQFKYVQGGMAIASDSQVTIPVDSRFVPEITGFFIMNNVRYKIVQVVKLPDGEPVPVAYTLIVRKGK